MNNQDSEFLYHAPCPQCGSSDALSVYSDGHSYCFSCQYYEHGDSMPEPSTPKKPSSLIEGDIKALARRKIALETCRKYGYLVGKSSRGQVHIAPYYRNGQLVAQHCRTPDKDFFWLGDSKGVELFGQHLFRPSNKGTSRVIITEGEIDCLSISQVLGNKWPVVSLPGGAAGGYKALSRNMEWVNSFDEVILAFDADQPGREAVSECVSLFDPGKVKVVVYPEGMKDANDMLKAGLISELVNACWQAGTFRPDGIISGSDLRSRLRKERSPGYELPWPGLNEYFEGIKKKRLYLLTAGSGIGKSTLAHEIGYHLVMHHGLTVGVMAMEESVEETAERYIGMHLNKPLQLKSVYEDTPEDEYWKAYNEVINEDKLHFYEHFGSNDCDTILNKLRYLRKGLGCDFVILDHVSIVVSGMETDNERKALDMLMTGMRKVVESTGVGVIAISHLKRPKDGKSWSEGRVPTLSDLRGSGGLEQLSDAVIALARNQTKEDVSENVGCYVLKNRWERKTGLAENMIYSMETGRILTDETNHGDTPF